MVAGAGHYSSRQTTAFTQGTCESEVRDAIIHVISNNKSFQ